MNGDTYSALSARDVYTAPSPDALEVVHVLFAVRVVHLRQHQPQRVVRASRTR